MLRVNWSGLIYRGPREFLWVPVIKVLPNKLDLLWPRKVQLWEPPSSRQGGPSESQCWGQITRSPRLWKVGLDGGGDSASREVNEHIILLLSLQYRYVPRSGQQRTHWGKALSYGACLACIGNQYLMHLLNPRWGYGIVNANTQHCRCTRTYLFNSVQHALSSLPGFGCLSDTAETGHAVPLPVFQLLVEGVGK